MKEGLTIAVVIGLVVCIPVICIVRLVVLSIGRLRRTFPRFSLRTMLFIATFLPPLIAGVWAVAQLQWYRSRGMPYGTDRAVRELERNLKARPSQ
jgi:hypothetical protein